MSDLPLHVPTRKNQRVRRGGRVETPLYTPVTVIQRISFALFLVLALATHSAYWRTGPFTWFPLLRLPGLSFNEPSQTQALDPATVGLLTLLPLIWLTSWLSARVMARRMPQSHRPWQWGWAGITLPLLGLTVLGLARLDTSSVSIVMLQLGAIMVVWPVYLYIVNETPRLTVPLAVVVLIQGAVAVGQFLHQGDLGITLLGERVLDPQVEGISVLWADGRRWLRAYGLTGHPNLLAALLAVLLLLLRPALSRTRGLSRLLLGLTCAMGLLGLLATVSRAAWLAFAVGLALWLLDWLRRGTPPEGRVTTRHRPSDIFTVVALLLLVLAFLLVFRNLVGSRFFSLDTALEARSLLERQRDMSLALAIVSSDPWQGTGLGRYLIVARSLDENARLVHNVFLLVAAELGILGGLLWLWLALAPMVHSARGWLRGQMGSLGRLAPWVAMVVIGLFHILPWISTGWRTALLVALVAGSWVVDTQMDGGNHA